MWLPEDLENTPLLIEVRKSLEGNAISNSLLTRNCGKKIIDL